MCGIAGVISADAKAVEPAVRAMMRAMVHRGPDDEGYEQFQVAAGGSSPGEATLGFGFRRLAILDLTSAGHQPMVHKATGDCLIFNGEIYNFRWLRAKLEALGANVRSSGDTEVLLHALVAWGEKALDQIDGMYAFAFYHAASRRVLLARDPFGIKPLYVAQSRQAFVFASEVRTVLASGLVPDDLDPAGIAAMLAYGAPQDPLTIHREIRSFPAGSCAWIGAEAATGRAPLSPRRFWRFPSVGQSLDEPTAVRRVQTQLNASVRDQCISDVPMGIFLSGGIDSATLAAVARSHLSPVNTFAVGFESAGGTDELPDAAATARVLGTHHVQTVLDDEWIQLQWREWLASADRPSIDGLNTFVVSGVVKQGGATVALSGIGADELFGGYPCFARAQKLARFLKPLAFVPPRLRRSAAAVALAALPAGKRAKAVDLIAGGGSCVELAASLRRVTSGRDLRSLGLEPGSLGLSEQYLPRAAFEAFTDPGGDPFNAVSQAESFLYMGNTLLRDADVNSMAHSLEIRVPFLGRWLVDLVGAIPGSVKAPKGAPPKHLLRKAAGAILPHDLFSRPKRGFTLPIGEWMFGPLRGECEAAIDTLAGCSALDGAAVRRLWDCYRSQPGAIHWSRPLALVVLGNSLR
ncbi:MAG: asparagine synthase (glutamine-hydrolyzing) [Planctomycetia bacterium]